MSSWKEVYDCCASFDKRTFDQSICESSCLNFALAFSLMLRLNLVMGSFGAVDDLCLMNIIGK